MDIPGLYIDKLHIIGRSGWTERAEVSMNITDDSILIRGKEERAKE